ncbi:MAG: hypothetical protein RLZZ65_1331 [Bacteroidota bacterium]|jgi:dihydrofolate reductase
MIQQLSLIAALDSENGIGKNNDLMWNLPADMRFFKETTKGHIVIMGRKNYDSIPEKYRPLAGRTNIVLSKTIDFSAPDCLVFDSLENCLRAIEVAPDQKVFIIGGAQIYKLALASGFVTEMFLTHIEKAYGADTFFPEFDETKFQKKRLFEQAPDEKHDAAFQVYQYNLL